MEQDGRRGFASGARRDARARAESGEDGAVVVEFAFLFLLVLLLLCGIIDVGDLLARRGGATTAIRSAAVRAFDESGNRSHDQKLLETLTIQLDNVGLPNLRRVIVYDASTRTSPPPACMNAPAGSGGVAGTCAVYEQPLLAQVKGGLADASFAGDDCAVGAADQRWCPVDRVQPAGWRVGIWIEVGYRAPTGFLPNLRNYTLTENVVVKMFPQV